MVGAFIEEEIDPGHAGAINGLVCANGHRADFPGCLVGQGSRDKQAGCAIHVLGFVGIKFPAGQHFSGHGSLRIVITEHGNFYLTGIHATLHQHTPVKGGRFQQGLAQVSALVAFGNPDRGAQVGRFNEQRIG